MLLYLSSFRADNRFSSLTRSHVARCKRKKHRNNNKVEYKMKMQEKHLFMKVVKNQEHQAECANNFGELKFRVILKLSFEAATSR